MEYRRAGYVSADLRGIDYSSPRSYILSIPVPHSVPSTLVPIIRLPTTGPVKFQGVQIHEKSYASTKVSVEERCGLPKKIIRATSVQIQPRGERATPRLAREAAKH